MTATQPDSRSTTREHAHWTRLGKVMGSSSETRRTTAGSPTRRSTCRCSSLCTTFPTGSGGIQRPRCRSSQTASTAPWSRRAPPPATRLWSSAAQASRNNALQAGPLDEIAIHLVPVLLGNGIRLFEPSAKQVELELVGIIESPTSPT